MAPSDISVNVLHPATYMDTTMVREAGVTPWSSVADGAEAVLALVTRESGSGRYFDGTSPSRAHEDTYDEQVRGRLERVTEELLRV